MNESVYRRLCMTSVCGAILIPATMVLVAEHGASGAVSPPTSTSVAMSVRDPGAAAVDVAAGMPQAAPAIATTR